MGNCSSCASSSSETNEYGCLDNALHIQAPVTGNGSHKVGSVHSREGAKGLNQDAALLYQGYGIEDGACCAVFDGHGLNGHIVSRVVRNQLPSLLVQHRKFMEWQESFVSAFKAADKEVNLLDEDFRFSGSTAVVVVKEGDELVIANLGDSRAVLGKLTDNGGVQATQLTVDLKPTVPAEATRIKNSKGRIFAHENEPHIQRVWLPHEDFPGLATSRAFGDFELKEHGIIVTPDVSRHRLTSEDLFIVLASDGVWDVLSNEEVVSVVWSAPDKETAAKAVVDEAAAAWKRKFPRARIDDCTVVCLFLQDRGDSLLPLTTS